jgi:branched-subunit amino acid transport protein AzlD
MLLYVLITAAAVTITRGFTFILFPAGKETPKVILFLGNALPCALMALLIVYCLKNTSPLVYPYGLPEVIAITIVILLHLWKKNNLLSIVGGTAFYMLLVQFVF